MKYLFALLFAVGAISCKKSNAVTTSSFNCDSLKEAVSAKNVAGVQLALADLLNRNYSNEKLDELATDISSNCDITAILKCFDCIKTNPAQSEMSLSFVVGDPVRQFVLDLAPSATNTIEVISIN